MKLVVGLGNPGAEYVGTRHNIGFEVIDALAQRLGWAGGAGGFEKMAKSRFDGLTLDGVLQTATGSEKLLLLKPMTFMNVSGRSVQAAMAFYQLAITDLLVVLDDLALPCGKLRLRADGSSGGHNGLKDIERMLGGNKYSRLRIGIDAPPQFIPGKDYVLQRFTAEQRKVLDPAVAKACGAVVTWADAGIAAAMTQFNGGETDVVVKK